MWWHEAVVYQIYPRSFADASGDGVGDLEGLRGRLEYLQWLGVDAIWLSPIFRSPMADFGYDVADYRDIDPLFGDLQTFDALLADAHARGIRVLLDWVPNHTSDQHPWFVESRASRDSPKRSWYRWRDGDSGVPPNNWRAAFADEPAWTWDEGTEQWYLHTFLPQQPDLNWDEPEVVAAMHDVLRFWMDRGVDGFRADVVHLIGKDPALADITTPDIVSYHDYEGTHALLRGIRGVLEEYPDRMMVGEVNLRETSLIAPYLGEDDELHLAFDFESLDVPWDPAAWRARIAHVEAVMGGRWPTWVFSNHDQRRVRTRLGGCEARARAALVLLLTLRGTPFPTPAMSSASRTPWCRPRAWWIPGAATAAARRCHGQMRPATAGPPSRGCHGRPSPRRAASRPSGPTRARSCTCAEPRWRCAAARRRCAWGRWSCSTTCPMACWPTSAPTATTAGLCG